MDEIGAMLKATRETTGISLEEASNDLKIKVLILENIEEGNIGCFKDIFVLKDHIYNYAKYLGLDPDKITDEFNEYLFEYTSKIPVEDIEKAVREQAKEPTEDRVVSPYTKTVTKYKKTNYLLLNLIVIALIILAIIWSVKQITINNEETKIISYVK